jgi:hypothetical protein
MTDEFWSTNRNSKQSQSCGWIVVLPGMKAIFDQSHNRHTQLLVLVAVSIMTLIRRIFEELHLTVFLMRSCSALGFINGSTGG